MKTKVTDKNYDKNNWSVKLTLDKSTHADVALTCSLKITCTNHSIGARFAWQIEVFSTVSITTFYWDWCHIQVVPPRIDIVCVVGITGWSHHDVSTSVKYLLQSAGPQLNNSEQHLADCSSLRVCVPWKSKVTKTLPFLKAESFQSHFLLEMSKDRLSFVAIETWIPPEHSVEIWQVFDHNSGLSPSGSNRGNM